MVSTPEIIRGVIFVIARSDAKAIQDPLVSRVDCDCFLVIGNAPPSPANDGVIRSPPASAVRPAVPMPVLGASAISARNSLLAENGVFSAVPCISTMPPVPGHHEIGVGVGFRVLGVVEIEHRLALVDAAGHRRHVILEHAAVIMLRAFIQARQSLSAIQAPVMAAVRVPPSACSTSQSTVICRSPSAGRSTTVRSERPISRWISCVRPDCLPAEASRRCARWWRAAACRIRPSPSRGPGPSATAAAALRARR
jgi:hypothetical protein